MIGFAANLLLANCKTILVFFISMTTPDAYYYCKQTDSNSFGCRKFLQNNCLFYVSDRLWCVYLGSVFLKCGWKIINDFPDGR